jgi:hypothetical protein
MKWDKLETFIIGHRDDVDDQMLPESVWGNIESGLNPVKNEQKFNYWQAAAVVFFALSMGLLVNTYRSGNSSDNLTQQESEFSSTEEYYFKVIKDKQIQLTSNLKQYPALAGDFKKDLGELSNNYKKLKKEFDKTDTEEVLNALIINLQLQQELLNNQLKIINLINEENENVSI